MMDFTQVLPLIVGAAAFGVTEVYKNLWFIRPDILEKTIWVPSAVVGIIGAVLLGLDQGLGVGTIIVNAIAYSTIAPGVVLAVKRSTSAKDN